MKRSICALAVLAVVSGASGMEIRFHLQVFGGTASSKYTEMPGGFVTIPEVHVATSSRVGSAAGIGGGFTLPLSPFFYYQGTFEYIEKGTRIGFCYWDEPMRYDVYRLGELSHSSFLKLKPFRSLSPYALAGYSISYVLTHKYIGPSGAPVDLINDTNRFERGAVVGLGLEFEGRRLGAFIEYRHHYGQANISKGTGGLDNYPVFYTRTDAFLAGIRCRLGRT